MGTRDLIRGALGSWRGGLVVSCQAQPDEPLRGAAIMSRMALAAALGGAVGIRADSAGDIIAIRRMVKIPVVGLVNRDYDDSPVRITPTRREVDELVAARPEMVAIDATNRPRPRGEALVQVVEHARDVLPHSQFMADVATPAEAVAAADLGFDCVSTTLVGFTDDTRGTSLVADHMAALATIVAAAAIPVVAEGRICSPRQAAAAVAIGAYTVVVGGAITRPQMLTAAYVAALLKQRAGIGDTAPGAHAGL